MDRADSFYTSFEHSRRAKPCICWECKRKCRATLLSKSRRFCPAEIMFDIYPRKCDHCIMQLFARMKRDAKQHAKDMRDAHRDKTKLCVCDEHECWCGYCCWKHIRDE